VKAVNGINYIYQENAGPAVARNEGVSVAKGNIIVFIDSDCVATPTWLTEMVKPFSDKTVAGVQGAYMLKQKSLSARLDHIDILSRYEIMKKHETIDVVSTYSAAYRKNVFLEMGGFNVKFPKANAEDTELSYKLAEAGYKLVFNQNAKASRIYGQKDDHSF